jgi:hypothetical protein
MGEEQKSQAAENKILEKGGEVNEQFRMLHNKKFHDLHRSLAIRTVHTG